MSGKCFCSCFKSWSKFSFLKSEEPQSSWCVYFWVMSPQCFSSCTSFQMYCNTSRSIPSVRCLTSLVNGWWRVRPKGSLPDTFPITRRFCTSKLCSCLLIIRHYYSEKFSDPLKSLGDIIPNVPFSTKSRPYLWCSGWFCSRRKKTQSFTGISSLNKINCLPRHLSKYRWSSCIDSFGLFYTALYSPLM